MIDDCEKCARIKIVTTFMDVSVLTKLKGIKLARLNPPPSFAITSVEERHGLYYVR